MYSELIQVLLPVSDNQGKPFPGDVLEGVKRRLVEKFGGVTAYARSPAEGIWAPTPENRQHDDVVIVEVMAPDLDEAWWTAFQKDLERKLDQDEIVVRTFRIRTLRQLSTTR